MCSNCSGSYEDPNATAPEQNELQALLERCGRNAELLKQNAEASERDQRVRQKSQEITQWVNGLLGRHV